MKVTGNNGTTVSLLLTHQALITWNGAMIHTKEIKK